MVPPVLVDLTGDSIPDIIIAMFNSSVIALDGSNFTEIWRHTIPNSETYSTPAAGYFDEDDTPDFFIKYSVGPGYPVYYHAECTIVNGRTGKPFFTQAIRDTIGSQASPLSVSVQSGGDFFLYWVSDCAKSGENEHFVFTHGTKIHEQSRSDLCKLRFGSEGISRMYAVNHGGKLPGSLIYDSKLAENTERSGLIDTTLDGAAYIQQHPQWNLLQNGRREKRHVGSHDGDGVQRLISTGSLMDSFGEGSAGSIDLVFATYLFSPAKTTVLLEADQTCVYEKINKQRMMKQADEGKPRLYGYDSAQLVLKPV